MSETPAMVRRGAILALAGCAAIAAVFLGWHASRNSRNALSGAELLTRLPTKEAVVLSVDFDALRRGGVLDLMAGSSAAEEPEYRTFVNNTRFNYRRDLDSALISFAPDGVFFLVRGRFDWDALRSYARDQGGSCYEDLCRMNGSTAERRISFLPLNRNLMALAVSKDDLAASRLRQASPQRSIQVPAQPVWLSIPPDALKHGNPVAGQAGPLGNVVASAISETEGVTLTLGPQGQRFEAQLEAVCRGPQEAALLKHQLEKATSVLREFATRGKGSAKSNAAPDELASILTGGLFNQEDRKVRGRWVVEKSFLENLASGIQ